MYGAPDNCPICTINRFSSSQIKPCLRFLYLCNCSVANYISPIGPNHGYTRLVMAPAQLSSKYHYHGIILVWVCLFNFSIYSIMNWSGNENLLSHSYFNSIACIVYFLFAINRSWYKFTCSLRITIRLIHV